MNDLEHLTPKKVEAICIRLWSVRGSLRGVGALLEQQSLSACYETDELFGLGQLCKSFSGQLDKIEDILRCGYDSRADKDIEEEGDDENMDENTQGMDQKILKATEKNGRQ